ncbi:hypothetical protein VTK73DRAFT_6342 [Phialemonium thermophilum]|uniref:Uncharacterized protein n=1 Tax=Phialemonium thermophilum TaxID=223376 RepID=A0ABR3V0S5_9PEZI
MVNERERARKAYAGRMAKSPRCLYLVRLLLVQSKPTAALCAAGFPPFSSSSLRPCVHYNQRTRRGAETRPKAQYETALEGFPRSHFLPSASTLAVSQNKRHSISHKRLPMQSIMGTKNRRKSRMQRGQGNRYKSRPPRSRERMARKERQRKPDRK